jgi:hypothetical protein
MAMEDLLSDLSGGFQGAGMGATMLGGMGAAKIAMASNPWVAGGLLSGGALLGMLGGEDPAKKRAMRLNSQLGDQELEMNRLDIRDKHTQQDLEAQKRHAWDQFGGMFSNYLSAMAKAKPTGPSAFNASLGVA